MQIIPSKQVNCLVCLEAEKNTLQVLPSCSHAFCSNCLKIYINTLKKYNSLTPQKLVCLSEGCVEQLPDCLINKLYPGQEGFVLNVVKKRYKQSKDPNVKIFNCKGYTRQNRQNLIQKTSSMSRDIHSKLMNQEVNKILQGKSCTEDKKICTNILSFNKLSMKQKVIQCYVCGVSYCPKCQNFSHDEKTKCEKQKNLLEYDPTFINKFSQLKIGKADIENNFNSKENPNSTQSIEAFIEANNMRKCLNPRCGVAIQKQEGCFWVKCRCSWQFCYPCRKLWGECEHFSKYPYKKFVPPPQWMVKALNLY